MTLLLSFTGAVVFSVCQNLLFSLFSVRKNKFSPNPGLIFSIPFIFLSMNFFKEKCPESAAYLPIAVCCFVFGFVIPVKSIIKPNRICNTGEALKYLWISVSVLLVWVLSFFKFTYFSSALCLLFYTVYGAVVSGKGTLRSDCAPKFRVITAIFSSVGIIIGAKITVKCCVLMNTAGEISYKYTVLGLVVICGFFAKIYSKKHLGTPMLCDISEALVLLCYSACRATDFGALLIPKALCRTDMPVLLMFTAMLATTALIHKKHTRAFGIIMLALYLLYILLTF